MLALNERVLTLIHLALTLTTCTLTLSLSALALIDGTLTPPHLGLQTTFPMTTLSRAMTRSKAAIFTLQELVLTPHKPALTLRESASPLTASVLTQRLSASTLSQGFIDLLG